jgi:lipoprotein-anchoring transpeptidase ErfK/SrfK
MIFGSLTMASLAFNPKERKNLGPLFPGEDLADPHGLGRVTTTSIRIYKEPSFNSDTIRWARRDDLIELIYELASPQGPSHNPRWYRLVGGYVHSSYIQRVESWQLHDPVDEIPAGGQLAEITVPYIRSMRYKQSNGWQPLYRLYFGTVHWVTHLDEGPDGEPWYGITDDRLRVVHHVPASHTRLIQPQELLPISPDVPPGEKRIELSIANQTLTAYEGDIPVFNAIVATGRRSYGPTPNGIPTDTPVGRFRISVKTPSRHMGDGELTSDIFAYELPGVPWVSFFHHDGIAFHGTYWHDNFGTRMSAGCVNMRNEEAKWLYRWTTPEVPPEEWYVTGRGTLVIVT